MDKSDWHNSDPPNAVDPADSANSSLREKIIEHLFVGELPRTLWQRGARRVELLRAEVDAGGYDLVVECNGIIRHIQLKSSYRGAKTSRVNINVGLQQKARGCVIWIMFDPRTMEIGPFLWLGKNAPTTRGCIAVEATRHNDKPNRTPRQRQISQAPKISTVDTIGARSAPWTRARLATVEDRNHGHGGITYGAHDLKARRDQS